MTNAKAIGILAIAVEAAKGRCFVTDEIISDAYDMAISALQEQDSPKPIAESVQNVSKEDLISRKAAVDEIMKELKDRSLHDDEETSEDFADGYDEGIRNAATRVYLMPSAEPEVLACGEGVLNAQPEIVRCKDCKHHHYEKDIPYCDRIDYGYGWKDNDYCSRAERRTDDQSK